MLSAFPLVVPFNQVHSRMSAVDKDAYFAILLATTLASILLITNLIFGPAAAIAATAAVLGVFACAWYAMPIRRRRRLR